MIQTHHRWKHATIPLSLDSSVDRFSKSSQFHGEMSSGLWRNYQNSLKLRKTKSFEVEGGNKKICCSYRNNERLVFHQIEVTDPVKKNDFYSGRYTFHC
ncbi:unnamed protein product [Brassica oleracea]